MSLEEGRDGSTYQRRWKCMKGECASKNAARDMG